MKTTEQKQQDQTAQPSQKTTTSESLSKSVNKGTYSIEDTNRGYYSVKNQNEVELQIFTKKEDAENFINQMEACDNPTDGQAWEAVQGTPFYIGKKGDGWTIGCGMYAHPCTFRTKEEAKNHVTSEITKTDYIMLAMYMEVLIDSKLSKQKMED